MLSILARRLFPLRHEELNDQGRDAFAFGIVQRGGGDAGAGFIGDPHGTREEVVVSAFVHEFDALLDDRGCIARRRIHDIGL